MAQPVTRILTLAPAATLSTTAAGAQALPESFGRRTTTPSNVAHVYVQNAQLNVYATSSTGKLTLVSGSLFKNTAGLMIGAVSRPLWSNSDE
jgi:hypothetical protein